MTGKPLYRLSGNIIDRKQRQGIDGLTIYAWDKDIFTWDDLLGKAVTENEGRFEIAFEWPRIRHFWTLWEDILDWRPDLYFEVYYRGKSISDFEVFYPDVAHPFRGRSVRWNVPKDVGDIKVELDGPTAKEPSAPEEFTVLGIVVEPDGQPIADLTVKAFDYDGQKETSLGDDETGTDGKYSIWYSAEQLQPEGKPWPDLIVRAYDKKGNEVASSPLHVNASAHEFIRLVMRNETYVGPSEYTVLHAKLQRLFADTDIADLTQEKIAYAAKKANLKTTSIELLVKAAQLQRKTALSAEVFYGLFREGLPSELPELLAQSPDSQRTALLAAVEKNIIPLQFGTDTAIQETLEKLKKLIVQQAFEPPPGQPQQPAPAALVATVLPEKKKQEDFIEHFITDSGSAEEFWKKLASKPGFNKDLAESVRFALQLGALTANNLPLVQKLQGMKQTGEIKALADLAQYDEKGWLELLEASTEASTSDPPPGAASNEDYAKALARKVEAAFPTAFATYRLKEDPNAKDIAIFFDKNQEYELRGSRLDSYLKGNPQKAKDTQNAIEGAGFDFEKTIKNVRTFQHLYKVTPGFKQTNALMKDGFDSAHSIARLSTKAFVDRYRKACGSLAEAVASDAVEEDAKKIYKKARQVEAMTSNLVVAFGPNIGRVGMRAVPDEAVQEVETPDGEKIPEWSTLFDSLDFCECEHCRSVYSPAAYLVDLLHFLKKRDSKVAGKNVKEILFERRPDLGDIELSCENTNTLVPYVDLVNEILEDAVVKEAEGPPRPFVPFVLSADDVESLDRGHLSDTIKNKFSANHFPLSPEETTIDVRRPGEWWRIETLRCTYTVQKEAGKQGQAAPVKVTTRSRQTSGTAEERAATPQYVNPDAYWTLRICLYPWSLPFDLHWEEVRAYLGHLGVPRHRIMEVFLPGERRAILEDPGLGLAREYLGFIPEEADILTKPYPDPPSKPKPWKLWGFEQLTLDPQHSIPDPADSTLRIASGHWLDVLGSRVDVFLQQSGLKYKELLDLLETWGAATLWGGNGGRTKSQKVFIQAPAENLDTCETSKMRLDGLSEIFAIKIVRFVRLWRKLGWTMRDLDRAITAFKEEAFQESEGKSITDQFITQLSHVQRLRNELNIPVVSLLSWWADMDTASYTDHNAPGRLQVPSLYAQLFRNRMVTNPLDPDFPEDPDDLGRGVPGAPSTPNTNNERPKLRDKTATLTAALGISAADLTLLIHEPRVIERIKNNDEEPDDKLTLSNLSKLYRHATLARALELPVREYLIALRLIHPDLPVSQNGTPHPPFDDTTETLLFVEKVRKIQNSGFTLAELDYLLRHQFVPSSGIAPSEEATAVVLDEIRSGLRKIATEYTFRENSLDLGGATTDPNGDLTRQKLALLNWDAALIEQVVATFNGAMVYEAPLGPLPAGLILPNDTGSYEVDLEEELPTGFAFPAPLRNVMAYDKEQKKLKASRLLSRLERTLLKEAAQEPEYQAYLEELFKLQDGLQGIITYDKKTDKDTGKLRFTGPMTEIRRVRLNEASDDENYENAITALFNAPRTFVKRYMRSFRFLPGHDFTTDLAALPASLQKSGFPQALRRKIYYTAPYDPYEVDLAALPAGFAFPDPLKKVISYDEGSKKLIATRILTSQEREDLRKGSEDKSYRTALEALFELQDSLGPKQLHFIGVMTEQERDTLRGLSTDPNDPHHKAYQKAVEALFDASAPKPNKPGPKVNDPFLTDGDVDVMFATPPMTAEDRFLLVLKKLIPYLKRMLSEELVEQKIAEALQLEPGIAQALLTERIFSAVDPANKHVALADFLDPSFAESHPEVKLVPKSFPAQFKTFTLLQKIATLTSRFNITARQMEWLCEYGPAVGWLDLNKLPTDEKDPAASFDQWLRLADLFQLRDGLQLGEMLLDRIFRLARTASISEVDLKGLPQNFAFPTELGDLVTYDAVNRKLKASHFLTKRERAPLADAANETNDTSLIIAVNTLFDSQASLLKPLSEHTRWDQGDLEYSVGAEGLNLFFPDAFRDERALRRLQDCFALLQRLGMSAEQCCRLTKWEKLSNSEEKRFRLAQEVMQAVKAKYDEAQWLNVAKPLRDVLREKQRAALVAYLVAHADLPSNVRGANDLYAHFLVDVEMSPCRMTSRIKQAISSTQLFVQRCLMNLEPEVLADTEADDDWLQWKWMKNYRVWEANRKIFVYPENWIEPELRDDKSPFFKELESELLQGDLTKETAETAFRHYLDKLDQVARLEIVGTYHQVEGKDIDILHVFGRTEGIPHVYYYRRWVKQSYWTAWERVDLDIEGDHLIPVVWNHRLYLFWPIFTEKTEPLQVNIKSGNFTSSDPEKKWEIKLAWSEHKQGKWANKKVSSSSSNDLDVNQYIFSVRKIKDDLQRFLGRWRIDQHNALTIVVGHERPYNVMGHKGGSLALVWVYSVCEGVAFRFDNCHGDPAVINESYSVYEKPMGTDFSRMFLKGMAGKQKLFLPAPADTEALANTPGTFRLLPHADGSRLSDRPFFYMDDRRSFFVRPSEISESYGTTYTLIGKKDGVKVTLYVPPEIRKRIDELIQQHGAQSGIIEEAAPRSAAGSSSVPVNNPVAGETRASYRYLFETFYHPYVGAFVGELNRHGVNGLLKRDVQRRPHALPAVEFFDFEGTYNPAEFEVSKPRRVEMGSGIYRADDWIEPRRLVVPPYPQEDVDFEYGGAYSLYNWELFFHAPLMIADRLYKNQRFEEAQRWFHYIFDPTDSSSEEIPQRYWQTKVFFETTRADYQTQRIQHLLKLLAVGGDPVARGKLPPDEQRQLRDLENSVANWRDDPFKPHLIARLRTTAYQKTVVMKYIDNLIAWGDQLFRRYTIESINEATQLYILAAEILGRRPEEVPPRVTPKVQTFNSVEEKLGEFSDLCVGFEDLVSSSRDGVSRSTAEPPPLPLPCVTYFCVPKNDKLLGYWDTVADRLFKIRHCMTIEGVVRELPLFEPPIEPGLLVRAAAAGVDISSVLNDINVALPNYRFSVLAQKATELCAELKSIGAALLSALEKKDAEALALKRAEHETGLLKLVEEVREQQLKEAEQALMGLRKSRDVAVTRWIHYQKLLGVQSPQVPGEGQPVAEQAASPQVTIKEEGGVKLIPYELEEMDKLQQANDYQEKASSADFAAQFGYHLPTIKAAYWGVGLQWGGYAIGLAASGFATYYRTESGESSYQGSRSAKLGQYAMRAHDWTLQSNLAAKEIMQIDTQIAAAEIRKEIATKELTNHRQQRENAQEVEEFMRDKYSNQELYGWMLGQIAGVFFQTYQLAYDVAKRAEAAYRFELGLKDSNFVRFGYWDNLKKGLLAGEKLYHDLKRMEVAYLEQNQREYEITKHVSLAQLDPLALIQLKQTGECFVSLPEALFDLDYPGHYMRRIKSVGVTIPCVTGPYIGVNCTLTLLKSSIRHGNLLLNGNKYARQEEDTRFIDNSGAIQSIVTSSGQNDSGLFETNLRDERYLPFEGAGAISEWRIELPRDFRQFDYDTISDVVLHLRYTAREAGGLLKQQATVELQTALDEFIRTEGQRGLARLFSLRYEFSSDWQRFLNPLAGDKNQKITMDLSAQRFPFPFQDKLNKFEAIELLVKINPDFVATHNPSNLKLSLEPGDAASANPIDQPKAWNGLLRGTKKLTEATNKPGHWTLAAWREEAGQKQKLDPNAVEDIVLVCCFKLS